MSEKEEKSLEFYLKEIDRVISEMENGNIDQLNSLLENFEYGSELIQKCNKILKEAELRVTKITEKIEKETREDNA